MSVLATYEELARIDKLVVLISSFRYLEKRENPTDRGLRFRQTTATKSGAHG